MDLSKPRSIVDSRHCKTEGFDEGDHAADSAVRISEGVEIQSTFAVTDEPAVEKFVLAVVEGVDHREEVPPHSRRLFRWRDPHGPQFGSRPFEAIESLLVKETRPILVRAEVIGVLVLFEGGEYRLQPFEPLRIVHGELDKLAHVTLPEMGRRWQIRIHREFMITTCRVTVWRALLDGECYQIASSRESLIRLLHEKNAWYHPEEDARWTVESSDEDVPIVSGKPFDVEDDAGIVYPHVAWDCPCCDRPHVTDVEPGDESPHLWFCAFGKGIVLVVA